MHTAIKIANIKFKSLNLSEHKKMVNNIKSTRRLEIMARLPKSDEVWNEIFESLILDNEPPIEYIKNVVITTKTGVRLKVSATDFVQILERERYIHPEESDILSCRLAINFDKVRKDVNTWAEKLIERFDNNGQVKKTRKPRTTKAKEETETPSKKTTRRKTATTTATETSESVPAKKTTTRKPSTRKKSQ